MTEQLQLSLDLDVLPALGARVLKKRITNKYAGEGVVAEVIHPSPRYDVVDGRINLLDPDGQWPPLENEDGSLATETIYRVEWRGNHTWGYYYAGDLKIL